MIARRLGSAASAAMALVCAGRASAADQEMRAVRYAPAPAWVTAVADAPAAPIRVVHVDQQVRVTPAGQEEYQDLRLQVLAPEGLPIRNLAVTWSPANEEVVVHRLAIVRDGKEIDLLPTQKFVVIQREDNLEQSALSGDLTATIQSAGLQVGDELTFAMTKTRRSGALGGGRKASCNSRSSARGERTASAWSSPRAVRWRCAPRRTCRRSPSARSRESASASIG